MDVEIWDQLVRRHATVVHTYINTRPRWEVESWDPCVSEGWMLIGAALENFETFFFVKIIFCELNVVDMVCWTNSCQTINK